MKSGFLGQALEPPTLDSADSALPHLSRRSQSWTLSQSAAKRGPQADSCLKLSSRGAACSLRCSKCSLGGADTILCRSCIAVYLAQRDPEGPIPVTISNCILLWLWLWLFECSSLHTDWAVMNLNCAKLARSRCAENAVLYQKRPKRCSVFTRSSQWQREANS